MSSFYVEFNSYKVGIVFAVYHRMRSMWASWSGTRLFLTFQYDQGGMHVDSFPSSTQPPTMINFFISLS